MAGDVILGNGPVREHWRGLLFRGLCAVAVIAWVHVALSLASVAHAGWIAATLGAVLAALVAWRVRGAPREFLGFTDLPRRSAGLSSGALLAWAGVIGALTLLPLLSTALPPFDDYANHLARIHVIADGGHDPALARFYAVVWRIIPDLGMDLLLVPLVPTLGIYAAGKLFLIVSTLLLLAGPFAIQGALLRRLSAGPLVSALFIHSYVEKMGVTNYVFGVGLAVMATAGWIALRERGPVARALVSAGCIVVLFFCHLVALGLYGLAIFSFEVWRFGAGLDRRRRIIDAAVLVLPFLLAVVLLLLGPHTDAPPLPTTWGGLHARLDGLRMLVQGYDPRLDLLLLLGMAAGLLAAARAGMLRLHPFGWLFLLVGGAAFLVIPNRAMGSWGAAARLPFGLVFVLSGALRWDLATARARAIFAAALLALMLLRTASTEAAFLRYDHVRQDFMASLTRVAPGSRIMIAADYARADDALRAIWELPCLAVIERSSLVSMEYSHPLGQVLEVRPAYRASTGGYNDDPVALADLLRPPSHDVPPYTIPYDPSGRIYWKGWPHDDDYVYIMDRADPASPAPERLEMLYVGDRVQLLRVRPH